MQPAYAPQSVELLMLTGFLGSGKTTLLSSFLASGSAHGAAVIVNEIGEIDLDGALLDGVTGRVPMALLSNGCVCCAAGSDLAVTIATLIEQRAAQGMPLHRIILETTGLALPGPILRGLGPLAEHLRAQVVSTFDLEHGLATLDLPEAAAQIAAAQRIVLNKSDRPGAMAVDEASALLAALNPLADVVGASDPALRSAEAFAPLQCVRSMHGVTQKLQSLAAMPSIEARRTRHSRIHTFLCRLPAPVECDALCEWLDNLTGAGGARLLRVKGLVQVAETPRPMLVQGVGTVFSPLVPMAIEAAESFLVVITRDMSLDELRNVQPRLPFILTRTAGTETPMGRKFADVLDELQPTPRYASTQANACGS